jgi:nitrogen fixation protein FixH
MSTITAAPVPVPANSARRWEPWPIALIAFFTVFIGLVASFITFAVRQKMDLVRPDYYEEEIRYQKQFDRIRRTQGLGVEVGMKSDVSGGNLVVRIPAGHVVGLQEGTLQLYRPSDAAQDRLIRLEPGADGVQWVALGDLGEGLWRAKLRWSAGGEEFSLDEEVLIPARR